MQNTEVLSSKMKAMVYGAGETRKKPPAAEENASLPVSLHSFLCLDVKLCPFIGNTVSMFLSDFLLSYQFVPTGSQLPHHPLLQRLFGGSMAPGGFMGGVEFCQPIIRGESSRLIIPLVFMNFFWALSPPTKEQYPTEKSRTSSQIQNSDVLSYLNIFRPLYCSHLSYTYNLLHILVCQSIPSWWLVLFLFAICMSLAHWLSVLFQ